MGVLFQLIFVALLSSVQGDIRFVCPRPQVPDSSMTQGPCGNGFGRPFYEDYMEITPGPMTLRWEETTSRRGAPMRVVLLDRDFMEASCVILDHIPHNDASQSSPTAQCKVNDYPLGKCRESLNFVTVEIPDIACERCMLQLISVYANENGESQQSCSQIDIGTNNCTTYYSCANVRIVPSGAGKSKNISNCGNYPEGLVDRWPYTEQIVHEATLPQPFDGTNFVRLFEKDGRLPFDINLFSANIFVNAESVVIVNPLNQVVLNVLDMEVDQLVFRGEMTGLSAQDMQFLQTGQLKIRMTAIGRGTLEFQISNRKEEYSPGRYRNQGINYTTNGWLTGTSFLGFRATYQLAIYPAGQCQPKDTTQYVVILRNSTGQTHGILAYTISGMIMSVKGLFTNTLFFLQFTVDSGFETLSLHSDLLKNRSIDGSESILPFLNSVSGKHPTDVSAALGQFALTFLNGAARRGMKALVYRGNRVIGIGVITFEDGSSFSVTVMLENNDGLFSNTTRVTLNGPAIASRTGPVIENLSSTMQFMGFDRETVVIQKRISLLNNLYPLYLWAGYLYVDVDDGMSTTPRAISGQFHRLTHAICEFMDNIACASRVEFSASQILPEYGPVVEPSAEAIAFLSNNNQTLTWGMIVRELRPSENVERVSLEQGGTSVVSFQDTAVVNSMFSTMTGEDKVLIGMGNIDLTPELKRVIQQGNTELILGTAFSNQGGGSILKGRIPSIQFTDLEPLGTTSASNAVTRLSTTQAPITTTTTPALTTATTTQAPTTTTTTQAPTTTTTASALTTTTTTQAPTTTTTTQAPTTTTTTPAPTTTTTTSAPTTTTTTQAPTTTTTTQAPTTTTTTPAPTTTTTTQAPTTIPTTQAPATTTTTQAPTTITTTQAPTTTTTAPAPTTTTTTQSPTTTTTQPPATTTMQPPTSTTQATTQSMTTATTTAQLPITTTPAMPTQPPPETTTQAPPQPAATSTTTQTPTTTTTSPVPSQPLMSTTPKTMTTTPEVQPTTTHMSTLGIMAATTTTQTTTTTGGPGRGQVVTGAGLVTESGAFKCKATGMFEDPYDCYYFHMCVSLGYLNRMIDYKMACPSRLVFDGRIKQCQWGYLVPRNCSGV